MVACRHEKSSATALPDIPAGIQFRVIPPIGHERIVKTCEIRDNITVLRIIRVGCPRGQHIGSAQQGQARRTDGEFVLACLPLQGRRFPGIYGGISTLCGVTITEDVIDEDHPVGSIRRGIPPKKIALQMPSTRPAVGQGPHGWLAVECVEAPLAELVIMLCPWVQLWPPPPQEMLDYSVRRTTTSANPQEGPYAARLYGATNVCAATASVASSHRLD
jgi:hypothetical protein